VSTYNATTGAAINSNFITGIVEPIGLALFGNTLFVADFGTGTVGTYDATTGASINRNFITGLFNTLGLAVLGNTLFVTDFGVGTVSTYNASTGAAINPNFITGLTLPAGLALSGNTLFVCGYLFVTNFFGGTVGSYNANTGATINPSFISGLQGPQFLALSSNTLFVANVAGTAGQYDAKTGAAINAGFITGLSAPFGLAIRFRFAAFSAELRDLYQYFQLAGGFTLAADSNGINPADENVTLQIGTSSFNIPPGSFSQAQDGTFFFTGTIDQVSFKAQIVPAGKKRFTYFFTGSGRDLGPLDQAKVRLSIGSNTGATR
jgi:WD40 repeat protein